MTHTILMRHRLLTLVAIFFFITPFAHAASVSFVPPSAQPSAGTPFIITVNLSTDSDLLNAVDGGILIPSGITITSVTTGDSLLKLWPVQPAYVINDREITFTGGIPGSLPEHTSGELLTFTGVAAQPGSYTFSTANIDAYLANGKGTQLPLAKASVDVAIAPAGKGAPMAQTTADKTAPVFTAVAIGRDPSLFNDQYFATFFATDANSGIAYYEVQEGWLKPFVRADRYYVLHDQTLNTQITIRAVDNAGNIATTVIPPKHPQLLVLVFILIGLAVFALGVYLFTRRR